MLFNKTPDDKNVLKTLFIRQFDYTHFLELFWRPYFIILSGQILIRFWVENIISTFKEHDKNTCLDRCGMRLRTLADLLDLAIVIAHFWQYIYL